MKSSGDFFNFQEQQFPDESNLFRGNGLSPDYDAGKKNLLENLEKFQKDSKYSFVVDWQIPENL